MTNNKEGRGRTLPLGSPLFLLDALVILSRSMPSTRSCLMLNLVIFITSYLCTTRTTLMHVRNVCGGAALDFDPKGRGDAP
jgi:hypothetical protein